ncbi:NAD(P)H-quinone oxidoreductase [Hyphomonas sp.]|uniref:NAD(P)H-quinone oxidoreductase n=1 Tax=Hyphomonas sp. TaxID=87 RepID=UPI00391D2861
MTGMMTAAHGEPGQKLALMDLPRPVPGQGEILIEVAAAGLNRADLAQRAGRYPPPAGASPILGLEVSGTVIETGPGASRFKPGDRVCALLAGGGYASHAAVDEGSALPVPEGMDLVTAACFPEAMMTVWANVFDRAGLKPGEAFLCHGATSGIGVMALQMARVAGASHVFGTAGSADKCALARDLGADLAINYREEDFEAAVKAAGGADVILDMVGGDYVQKNIGAAKVDGRIINIAYQSGMSVTVNFGLVLMKRLSLMATTLRARPAPEKSRIRAAVELDFWPHVASGRIRAVLDSTYPLAEAEAALARMEEGGHSGKILLTV